jgi:hypothetical protein
MTYCERWNSLGNVPCTWSVVKRASDSRIAYNPLPDITPESEVRTLAAVYAFILERHTARKTGESSDEDAETKLRLHKERRPPCEVDD